MKKLAVLLAKGTVKTYTAYPATTILGYLIDLVTIQENATRTALERIEGQVNDIQENPFRVGKLNLAEAKTIRDSGLKRDRIIKALDAFGQASQFSSIKNPLIPVKAKFFAGACYDLLNEGETALLVYEDVFREAKKFEQMIPKGAVSRYDRSFWEKFEGTLETIFDLFSFPGDVIDEWFQKRGKDHKEKQQFLEILIRSKSNLELFLENLLVIITTRKGISREEYLKPYTPKQRTFGRLNLQNLWGARPILTQQRLQSQAGERRQGVPSLAIRCFKCYSMKIWETCPVCKGSGKVQPRVAGRAMLPVTCTRCSGKGKTFVCNCDKSTGSIFRTPSNPVRRTCLACGGKGKISTTGGLTWVPCRICGGSGFSRGF